METFDLNFTVQLDPKGPKKHYGFHIQATDEDEAKAILGADLADVVKQCGTAPKAAAKKKVAAPAAPKAAAAKKKAAK